MALGDRAPAWRATALGAPARGRMLRHGARSGGQAGDRGRPARPSYAAAVTSPVLAARELAERVLVPDAERVDVEGVRPATVAAIGAAGLLGLAGPRGYGGADAPAPVQREVTEVLAGADGTTWFVVNQHANPLQSLARSDNVALKERSLRALCTGGALSGVAVAHLRRPGTPVAATRAPGGWSFSGTVPWLTGWGLADVFLLAGETPDREVVLALVPARERPGLTAGPPMRLAAMQGSCTVAVELRDLAVPDADVTEVLRRDDWVEADRLKTANASPAVFGLLATVVRDLAGTARRRDDPLAADLAARLGDEAEELRRSAYALLDHVPPYEQVEDRLALRAAALELGVRAATALVAATGGGAMALQAAPQRLAREALFHLVQAQTGPVREATLRHLRERTR